MIQVQADVQIRENLLARLMELPNRTVSFIYVLYSPTVG